MENVFRRTHLQNHSRAPVGGIIAGGWKLVATNVITARLKAWDAGEKEVDLSYSIGLQLSDEGGVKEVVKFPPRSKPEWWRAARS